MPDFTTVEAKPHEIVNPIHIAFKSALLPILVENTRLVRKAMKPVNKNVINPQMMEFITMCRQWIGSADNHAGQVMCILFDEITKSTPGTAKKLWSKNKETHHFMPLSVIVPMKQYDGHAYMLRMPHIVFRVDSAQVLCVTENGTNDAVYMSVIGGKCIPATDEEIFACVDELTPTQIAAMLVHEYFRPILHTMLGMAEDDEDTEEKPQEAF